jgi:transcriptional regulator with GAF, ATPase, and Fis domain
MLDLPSRADLAALTDAAHALLPTAALGLSRSAGDGLVSVVYLSSQGIGSHLIPADDLPSGLRPTAVGFTEIMPTEIEARPDAATEWQLRFYGVQRVLAAAVPGVDPATRLWLGRADTDAPSSSEIAGLERLASSCAGILNQQPSAAEQLERWQRLDLAAGLLPALLHVLDVREVFTRLSAAARLALPHDRLLLTQFSDDLTLATVYALSDQGPTASPPFPHGYSTAALRVWAYSIIDDLRLHPLEANSDLGRLGLRSVLRLAVKFDDHAIAGLAFLSATPAAYATSDVVVARRLADYVAAALSHHALAEQIADEARRNAKLRVDSSNLEMLDALLGTLIDAGVLPDVFARISSIAARVLPHDAAVLMVRLPDGRHARVYASSTSAITLPTTTEVPEELLRHPEWEHDIFDDLRALAPRYAPLVAMGFRSLLRVPIRLEGRFAGALVFMAKTPDTFKPAHVPVARRMADRMAVTLARDREIDAERRADEASERASRLEARVRALTDELDARTGYRRVVGESRQWRQVLTQATQVAATETTALLLGESGTGKEVVARFVHRASPRNGGPFVAINCAALPEQLLEAELFGYERGAFTGAVQSKPGQLEQAAGGTLFLDEVGEMSPSAQAKFLRVLQEREFQRLGGTRVLRSEARVVAATNRDLPRAIANGQFREDLYYRLNVFAIRLPPLRDRTADVLPLADAFLKEIGRGLGRPPGGISKDAREMLVAYHWPGNVRELRNILERAAILCEGGLITAEYLGLNVMAAPPPPVPAPAALAAEAAPSSGASAVAVAAPPSSAEGLASIEKAMIETALQNARFNKSKAAKALGMTRHQLYIRMRKHGLE